MGVDDLEVRVLTLEKRLLSFSEDLRFALGYISSDARSSLAKSRVVLEQLLVQIYKLETSKEPRRPLLAEMLNDNQFTRKIERRVLSRMNAIRDMGNLGVHGELVEAREAGRALDDLCETLDWYLKRYDPITAPTPAGRKDRPPAGDPAFQWTKSIAFRLLVPIVISVLAAVAVGLWARQAGWLADNTPQIEVTPREPVGDPDAAP
jgi:hypothetical protein